MNMPVSQEGIPDDVEVFYVGSLPTEVEIGEQEVRAAPPGSWSCSRHVPCCLW
jgi:hypothetical protein